MTTSKDMVDKYLQLNVDQFFGEVVELFEDIEDELLDEDDFEGIAINAPELLQLGSYDMLPVIMATRQTLLRGNEILLANNCFAASVNLDTDEVLFGKAIVNFRRMAFATQPPKPPRPPLTDDVDLEGETAKLHRFDTVNRLELPWEPARLRLVVISHDWVSNLVEVELKGDEPPLSGEETCVDPPPPEDFDEDEPDFPLYEENDQTPKLEGDGFAIAIDHELIGQGRLVVRGAYSMIAKERHLPCDPEIHHLSDGEEIHAAAVVPVTLAITKLDWDLPLRVDWAVPAYSEIILKPGDKIKGAFAIDLLDDEDQEFELEPGAYLVYAFMDGGVRGPQKFTIK